MKRDYLYDDNRWGGARSTLPHPTYVDHGGRNKRTGGERKPQGGLVEVQGHILTRLHYTCPPLRKRAFVLQPFLALEHLLVHPQSPLLHPRAPCALCGLLRLSILRSAGGRSDRLDVVHNHPKESFPNIHNHLGVLPRLSVPSCQFLLQLLHRSLGVLQEVGAVGSNLLNEVIEEGEDLCDFPVKRLGESANNIHIDGLRDRGEGGGELEREIIQHVFNRFTTLALSLALGERCVKFSVGLGGRSGGRGGWGRIGKIGTVVHNKDILGRSTYDILMRILGVVIRT